LSSVAVSATAGRVLRRQFDHAVIRQNDVRTIGDEEPSVKLNAEIAQLLDFVEKCERIEDYTIANDAATVLAEDSAGDELQNELLAADDDGMAGVVATGVTRDH
jgi:hypothetical protein